MLSRLPNARTEIRDGRLSVIVEGLGDADRVTVRIRSDRNRRITRHTDTPPLAPEGYQRNQAMHHLVWGAEMPPQARDIFYPVIDLDLGSLGTPAVGEARVEGAQRVTINSWKTTGYEEADGTGRALLPLADLENWENWLLAIGEEGTELGDAEFALLFSPKPDDGRVEVSAAVLGNTWSGLVEVEVIEPEELLTTLVASLRVREPKAFDPANGSLVMDIGKAPVPVTTDRAALEADLGLCLDFITASQNRTPGSPYEKGLYLYYDIDARTWRAPHWTWTWGPSIRVALDAVAAAPSLADRADDLRQLALDAGELSLGVIVDEPDLPAHGMGIARWDPLPEVRRGSEKFASLADPLFLAGWAWGRLHDETGDDRYIDAMRTLAETSDSHVTQYGVVQQDWLFERGRWLERILDEAGFGAKGRAELFRLTGDNGLPGLIGRYMNPLRERLERPDGGWDRFWYVADSARTPTECMTRGLGWAMEGLLSSYTATGEEDYLDAAKRMAAELIRNQRADGGWTFMYDRSVEEVGMSDKGTPLWSLLLYRLHAETGDAEHLKAARAALAWSRSHMRRGPNDEARGGIVGVTPQSGIAYRPWFRVCCTYSTAFAAQAIIHELQVQDAAK